MATTVYLKVARATTSRGRNDNDLTGSARPWQVRALSTTVGTDAGTEATVTSVAGPTSGIETGGTAANEWLSEPLDAGVTISGTITFNICANEAGNNNNATIGIRVERVDNVGEVISTVCTSSFVTELTTSNARKTWTVTPTSTSFNKGDRIRVRVYFDDAGTMGGGAALTLTYDGANASTADSRVQFNENLTFMTAGGGTTIYPTNVASDIAEGKVEYNAWTTRGDGA